MRLSDKMEDIKPFGFRRNWDYVRACFFLIWKSYTEYKVNFYSGVILEVIWVFVSLLYFIVVSDNFGSIINWGIEDFFLFYTVANLSGVIIGFFTWKTKLFLFITNGTLNSYLVKPKNVFLYYILFNLDTVVITFILGDFILFFLVVYYFNLHLVNLLISVLIFVLSTILNIMIIYFMDSLNFMMKNSSKIIQEPYRKVNGLLEDYPAQFFDGSLFKVILYFFSNFYVAFLIVPLLLGHEVLNLDVYLYVLIGLLIVFLGGTLIIWHYGLKKYEAFG